MPLSPRTRLAWKWCLATLSMFVIACATPAIDFGPREVKERPSDPHSLSGPVRGSAALAFGPILFEGAWGPRARPEFRPVLTWLANPIGLFGVLFLACRAPIMAAMAAIVAIGLGIAYLCFPFGRPLIGAYMWVGSAGVLLTGSISLWRMKAKTPIAPTPSEAASATVPERLPADASNRA